MECDGQYHSNDGGNTWNSYAVAGYSSCGNVNSSAALGTGGRYWQAWYLAGNMVPMSAPLAVGASACGPCVDGSNCYYKSRVTMRASSTSNLCYGVILYGCPAQYGAKSCNTSSSGCGHSVVDPATGTCKCNKGYYGSAADSCFPCPTHTSAKQTSPIGSTSASSCYLPTGTQISDTYGTYKAGAQCPYN